jgi:hypothetical protein
MTALKRSPAHTGNLVLWTWTAVALTLVGWFWGLLAIAYSHLGDVTDVSMMTGGVVLFAEAPGAAVVLAIHAARAGHRSGRIAVVVSGLLLLATIVALTLVTWWIGLAVTAVVAALVFAGARSSSRIVLAVCGWLLLATLVITWLPWPIGLVAIAVLAVAVFIQARSRNKPPPPGPDGAQHGEGPPAAPAPPGAYGRPS